MLLYLSLVEVYTMNKKVPPTASNRRKRELAREGDLLTYKRKRKTIGPSIVVPPNTFDNANEDVCEGVNIPTESAEGVNILQDSEFETESAQAGLGAQPPLLNVCPNFDENIYIFGGYSDAGGAGNSLSLKKLKSHYAYKLEKVLSDGTAAAAKKKKGLTTRYGGTALLNFREALNNYKLEDHYEHSSRSPNINLNDQQITALNDQLQKLNEDKEKESEANINLREALKEKCKEIELLKAVNALLMEQIDLQLPPVTPLAVLQLHQLVPDTTLAKKYEDLLAAHEDIKKKLIVKEDFIFLQRQKLVNAEERMKPLDTNNSKWEVWRQALKKVLASEGMRDMGDPTFKELFKQNERFFTIVQQGPKGDYQEDLVSTV
ncbi:hypothetical protein GIB67_032479, partial [Kingdonia uniflora]